jgi:hypothetical protein
MSPAATIDGRLQRRSEIEMEIVGTHRRILVEHEIFVFCGCRQQL